VSFNDLLAVVTDSRSSEKNRQFWQS